MRLALALGMPVREMLKQLSSREISEWAAYDRLEPFGEGRLTLTVGMLSALTANINRDTAKAPEPFKPDDFVPFHNPPQPPKRPRGKRQPDDVAARLKAFLKSRK